MEKPVRAGIGIMLLKDGKILLGKRHDDPEKADSELHGEGSWTMPGGKLNFGDVIHEGAAREVEEETGLIVNNLKLISVTNEIVMDAHFVTIGFLATDFEGEPKVMEPDEITEWCWFSIDNLPSNIYPPSLKLLKNFLASEIYKH